MERYTLDSAGCTRAAWRYMYSDLHVSDSAGQTEIPDCVYTFVCRVCREDDGWIFGDRIISVYKDLYFFILYYIRSCGMVRYQM